MNNDVVPWSADLLALQVIQRNRHTECQDSNFQLFLYLIIPQISVKGKICKVCLYLNTTCTRATEIYLFKIFWTSKTFLQGSLNRKKE